jgi:hypothetical protein
MEDLHDRGMLDDTIVLMMGEFGRTPRFNKEAGRDHWAKCYSLIAAGGGFTRGAVYGKSDRIAGEVVSDPVRPEDLLATVYHQLGIPLSTEIHDPINARILAVSEDRIAGFLEDPFTEIARLSELPIATVLERIREMLAAGTIRRVRQTMMATNLAPGALVAWRVPADRLDAAFDFLAKEEPFSGHVVIRSTDAETTGSAYRLWTTLKVPQGFSMRKHCDYLGKRRAPNCSAGASRSQTSRRTSRTRARVGRLIVGERFQVGATSGSRPGRALERTSLARCKVSRLKRSQTQLPARFLSRCTGVRFVTSACASQRETSR